MKFPVDHVLRRARKEQNGSPDTRSRITGWEAAPAPDPHVETATDPAAGADAQGEPTMQHAVLELRDVCRVFDTDPPVSALSHVDLRVDHGEYVAIVGPSGSGKSTLLNVLGLLDRPSSGEYLLDGVDVARLGDGQRAAWRAERLGFVFQSFHLLSNRTVLENVMFGQLYQGVGHRQRRDRSMAALERVGVAHRASFQPGRLSGGERQRVAIARALAMEPSLLLCDEPTGNLDSVNTRSILDLFDGLIDDGLTLVVITHDSGVAERAPRRVRITDGVLVEETTEAMSVAAGLGSDVDA